MARPATLREAADAAVGEPIERWIERQRTSSARLTYPQIARVLLEQHRVVVHPETLRAWHGDLPTATRSSSPAGEVA